ncbi:MFS transporter [Blastococcus sp. TML/C7B]|nr:MFS transporter [Blastococcus sp. TML/C7B]MBN1097631.1 MFS transporter [Blastococcus sp. TML/C7B]
MTSPDPLTDHQPLPTAEGPGRLAGWRALRPLRHRDYRLLFGFLATSLCAIGMWTIVMVFQVLAIDDRPQALSAVGACLSAGLLAFAVVGGVAADRYPRRMVLVAVQLLNTLTLSAVAALSLSGAVGLWHLALASALLGAGSAFTFPAYSAYLPQVLPGEELLAANGLEGALRPTMQQGLGPALGGAVVGATMPGVGALVAAVLSAVALSCTLLLSTRHDLPPTAGDATPRPRLLTELRDGVTFVVRTRWLLWTLLFASVMTLAIMGPLEVLLPFRVREEFSNGEQAFGLLLAAYGVGGAAGSLVMSSLRLPRRYLTTMVLLWGAGTLPLALVGLTSAFWLLLACLLRYRSLDRRRHGHLGHAAAAPRASAHDRARRQPGLLRLHRPHATVDRPRRAAGDSRPDTGHLPFRGGRPGLRRGRRRDRWSPGTRRKRAPVGLRAPRD